MTEQQHEGGCQCGAIRYRITGAPLFAAMCHCMACRRAHAAPAVAWAMFQEAQVSFLAGQPKEYASSAEGRRGFCPACGSQICFTASFIPGLIDIAIGSLDHPEVLPPTLHYWESKRLPWMQFSDGWPRFPELPPFE